MAKRSEIPAEQRFSVWHEDGGAIFFINYGPVNPNWGYRGCGAFSCSPAERDANIRAMQANGRLVFHADEFRI